MDVPGSSLLSPATTPAAPVTDRIPGIDALKAAAIIGVVLTHSGFGIFDPRTTVLERWCRFVLSGFHVPTFLAVAGILYWTPSPANGRTVGRRLARILVPYVVASVVAQVLGWAPVNRWNDVVWQLATGDTVGIYYFVILLVGCVLLAWPFSYLSSGAQVAAVAVLLAYNTVTCFLPELSPLETPFAAARDPIHFAGYFFVGWLLRTRWDLVTGAGVGARVAATAAITAYVLSHRSPIFVLTLQAPLRALYTAGLVTIALVAVRRVPRWVETLSELTLPVYLWHWWIMQAVIPVVGDWPSWLRMALLFSSGLGGGLTVALVARRLLGDRARLLFGA